MHTSTVVKSLTPRFLLRPATDVEAGHAALHLHIKPARTAELLSAPARHVDSIRRAGFFLFMISFVASDMALDGTGIGAFLLAPVAAALALSHAWVAASWPAAMLGTLLVFAWLTNAAIFFNLRPSLAGLALGAPWALYLALLMRSPDAVFDPQIVSFVPFYLWAAGIGLIQISRILEQNARTLVRPAWQAPRARRAA